MASRKSSRTRRSKSKRVLEQINFDAAGIDAGSTHHYVAVPDDRAIPSVRRFETTTSGLYQLADWLIEAGITTVAVEATGVYCMPLIEVLEARDIEVVLAKPSSLKSVNDRRKTDMVDCQWIQILHTFGLLRGSYRPGELVRTYRAYSRQRQMLTEQASTAIEHMKKALTQMNVRIDQAVSDVTGVTGLAIIRAIVDGERDPAELAKLRAPGCAKSEEQIQEALFGKFNDEHLFALDQALRSWEHYRSQIEQCNQRLEEAAANFEKKVSRDSIPNPRRIEHVRKNVLPFEARSLFFEVFGQDLTQIDGISTGTVSILLAEVGTNVDSFPTEGHFASWLNVSGGNSITGGKRGSGRNRPTTNRLATALRLSAQSLSRSDSALGAFYRRLRARIGAEKAITATAHKLARMIYFTLKFQRPYVDPGSDYYSRKNEQHVLKRLEKTAKAMGYELRKTA